MNQKKKVSPVAVIGMSCLFPRSPGVKEYWRLLYHGENAVTEVPETHWRAADYYDANPKTMDHTYCTRGGYLSPVPFNPAEFGIPPSTLEATDTSQLLGLVAARMALDDAGYGRNRDFDRDRVSVLLGATVTQELVITLGSRLGHPHWRRALEDSGLPPEKTREVMERISDAYVPWQESSFPGLLGNVISGRIANRFNFGGVNTTLDSACASSLSALNLAFMELQNDDSDMVLTGGVDTLNDIFMHMCFAQTGVLSHTGSVKAFSDQADGTILAEGVGILILKRLDRAEQDGDKIYGVIRSVAGSSDGKSLSIYAPSAKGQAKAIRRAYADAGFSPATVELIEAHGTGTRGDVVEFEGLTQVFGEAQAKKNACALGSVKSNIGHAKAAAGVAGVIKGLLALYHKVLPPTVNVGTPDPKLSIADSPFYLCTEARPWPTPEGGLPRRCGVTACGFGGSNFHVVLEEYGGEKNKTAWDGSVDILAFSGPSTGDIIARIRAFTAETVCDLPLFRCDQAFRFAASQSRAAFNPKEKARLLVIIGTDDVPSEKLNRAVEGLESDRHESLARQNIFIGTSEETPDKPAFLFPGQGSQYIHMGRDIINVFPEARELLEKINAHGEPEGPRLSDILYPLPDHIIGRKEAEERLRQTDKAQPAIGTVSLAMHRVLERFHVTPRVTCGHSYGELSALCAAGWIDVDTFLDLSVSRGRYMAACADGGEAGTMLAVRAPLDRLDELTASSGLDVVLANRNAPEQGVLSGSADAIEKAEALCRENGFRTTRLPVAAAFHSRLVEAAAKPFGDAVKKHSIRPTDIPVYSNTTGKAYPASTPDDIASLLGNQLINPVRFVDTIEAMYAEGIRTFVEVGPKTVLSGLVSSILKDRKATILALDASTGAKFGLLDLARALCTLSAAGHGVDLTQWEDAVDKPEKPAMSIPISGANYKTPRTPRPKTAMTLAPEPEAKKPVPQTEKPQATVPLTTVTPAPQPRRSEPAMNSNDTLQPRIINDALAVIQEGLRSMQAIQTQTAEAHNRFLDAQAEAGKTLQAIMDKAQTMMRGTAVPAFNETATAPVGPRPQPPAAPEVSARTTTTTVPTAVRPEPAPAVPAKAPRPAVPVKTQAPTPSPSARTSDFRKTVETHMLAVVSELTGYPVDMIGLDMDIESDLGIDSIKRVEIMSAFEERVPDLPPVSPDAMAAMKTLGQIVDSLVQAEPSTAKVPGAPAPVPSVDMDRVTQTMLAVVSDLTGYPVEMIGLDMDIESDLGIDSIKRVEIMSTFEERMPDLPPVSPDAMGSMKTLAQILAHVAEQTPAARVHAPAPSAPAVDMDRITQTMLAVVSDLTGYPVEMIGLDMDIESDLGIDSIKRVEIMSAFEERMPDLPPVSPDAMGSMKTLAQILAHVADQTPAAAADAPVPAADEDVIYIDMDQLTRVMLQVVSDLTGYPVEMIGLDMDIESDLGIDSIKRVEIMSEFEARMPELPPASPDAMGSMKTLAQILAHVVDCCSDTNTPEAPQASASSAPPALDTDRLTRIMLQVVSDLTGYPVDMIGLDMDIESDLGIDSIKRVEIMSEFEGRVPDFPGVDTEVMGSLKTLEQILAHIGGRTAAPSVEPSAAAPAPSPTPVPDAAEPADVSRRIIIATPVDLNSSEPLDLPRGKTVYVTDDKNGLSKALVDELNRRKIPSRLIAPNGKTPDAAGLVIVSEHRKKRSGALSALTGFKKKEQGLWDAAQDHMLRQAFELARQTGPVLLESAKQGDAFFVTITRTDGLFGFSGKPFDAPVLGGLSGLSKTAAHEWQDVSCKALDLSPSEKPSETLVASLVDEMLHRGPVEVGFSEDRRYAFSLTPTPVSPGSVDLEPGDLVVVSGGARGVTAATAVALAETCRPAMVLLGRSPEPEPEPDWLTGLTDAPAIKKAILTHEFTGQNATPAQVDKVFRRIMGNREVADTLSRLRAVCPTVLYRSVDVRDASAVSAVIQAITADHGPVRALIHGAGVLEDRFIVDQTPEQFDRVYSTKVRGLESLLDASGIENLKYLVLFSSVAARIGNSGQVAYAVANEVLNKVGRAAAQQNPLCRVVSINWGPWDGGMVTDSLKKEFARKNVELIPLERGARCMVEEMAGAANRDIEVVIGGTFPTPRPEKPVSPPPDKTSARHLSLSFKKEVDTRSYPILEAHVIDHKPVVPFALMTEWFGHGALHSHPGFVLHGLDRMRVLSGIKIDHEPRTIRLMSGKLEKKGPFFEVELEIRNGHKDKEHVHSRARALLTERMPQAPTYTVPREILAQPYANDLREAYERVLFHGPQLQGITEVLGCSSRGMAATVSSAPAPSAWIAEPLRTNWVTDPLVLDSAYQMAILWCHDQKGMASLPSYSESYRQYCRTFPQDGMTVVMEVRSVTDHKMTSDFTFLSRDNTVVATISGYEAVMDASLTEAFGKKDSRNQEAGPLFDREKLLAYAIGKPSEAFGKPYEVFDRDRIIARLPGPPYFFMDRVTAIDHPAWELKSGGWIEAAYTVPENEWYFRANRSDAMPFCVLLEIALQPCGFLAAYAGSALHSDKQLKFRNLGGKAVLFREVTRKTGTLTMRTRLTKVSEAAGMIIEDFDIKILNNGELIYDGTTNFGFFTNETMEQQVGIRNPEKIMFTPDAEAMKNARSITFPAEAPLTPDDTGETPCAAAAMPSKALLMIDGIDCYIEDGGPFGLGYVRGYKNVDPDEWFFKAHFYQDPVCPGSLGIESFIQLIKFAALEKFGDLAETHRFEFITGSDNEWLYRGQVIPRNKKVEVTALITSVTDGEAPEIIADGYLCVDGLLIYQMKQFGIRLTPLP
ncbi:hypothetical protein JCM14469_11590 [Desulfatiferula olefinivorans]